MPESSHCASIPIQAPLAAVLAFMQHDPEGYLAIAKLTVQRQLSRQAAAGEWQVSEQVGLPLVPRTTFRIRWQPAPTGAQWQSWAAAGTYVVNTFEVADGPTANSTLLTETVILQCPFYVQPLVRPIMLRAHRALRTALQQHFAAGTTPTPPAS